MSNKSYGCLDECIGCLGCIGIPLFLLWGMAHPVSFWIIVGTVVILWITLWIVEKERIRSLQLAEEERLRSLQLADIDYMEGFEFEEYICNLLRFKGFEVEHTRGSGDFGVDIVASKEGFRYAVQVKRRNSPVSRRAISDAVGGMAKYDCNVAMVITNNYFTEGAKELAKANKCILIDRNELASWIYDFQMAEEKQKEKKEDEEYFKKMHELDEELEDYDYLDDITGRDDKPWI